jgi:hypothetical protein
MYIIYSSKHNRFWNGQAFAATRSNAVQYSVLPIINSILAKNPNAHAIKLGASNVY